MATSVVAVTKSAIPRPLRSLVSRPRLLERLDDDSYRVALVSAAAGFGKTCLLAEWAAGRPESPVGSSCDAADAEPTRFWTGLLASVSTRWPGVGDDAAVRLQRDGGDSADVAASLANDLGEVGEP